MSSFCSLIPSRPSDLLETSALNQNCTHEIKDPMLYVNTKFYTVEKFTLGHVVAHAWCGWLCICIYMRMRNSVHLMGTRAHPG